MVQRSRTQRSCFLLYRRFPWVGSSATKENAESARAQKTMHGRILMNQTKVAIEREGSQRQQVWAAAYRWSPTCNTDSRAYNRQENDQIKQLPMTLTCLLR